MSNLIKAYADELNKVQEEIEDMWSKYGDGVVGDTIEEQEKFDIEIGELYNRKAVLKAQINDLKQQPRTK